MWKWTYKLYNAGHLMNLSRVLCLLLSLSPFVWRNETHFKTRRMEDNMTMRKRENAWEETLFLIDLIERYKYIFFKMHEGGRRHSGFAINQLKINYEIPTNQPTDRPKNGHNTSNKHSLKWTSFAILQSNKGFVISKKNTLKVYYLLGDKWFLAQSDLYS